MGKIIILLPALNERKTIVEVIRELPLKELRRGHNVEVVVGDSGSANGTPELARQEGASVIYGGLGKGRNIRACIGIINCDYLFMLDSDGTYPAMYIPAMLYGLERGYDVVYGSRLDGVILPGAMSSLNKVGNYILTTIANMLYKTKTTDLCSGLWGFKMESLKRMNLSAVNFELEADIFVETNRLGLKITSMPIVYRSRKDTKTKLRSLTDGWAIIKWLIKKRFYDK